MINCPRIKSVIPNGAWFLSLELAENADPSDGRLRHQPAKPIHELDDEKKGEEGCLGLGSNGEEWFCVECIERLMEEMKTFFPGYDPAFLAIYAIRNWIKADERHRREHPRLLNPNLAHVFAVEKWKAVNNYDRWHLHGRPKKFKLWAPNWIENRKTVRGRGLDLETIYLYTDRKDMKASFWNSMPAMISIADTRGKTLSELLRFVDRMVWDYLAYRYKMQIYQLSSSMYELGFPKADWLWEDNAGDVQCTMKEGTSEQENYEQWATSEFWDPVPPTWVATEGRPWPPSACFNPRSAALVAPPQPQGLAPPATDSASTDDSEDSSGEGSPLRGRKRDRREAEVDTTARSATSTSSSPIARKRLRRDKRVSISTTAGEYQGCRGGYVEDRELRKMLYETG